MEIKNVLSVTSGGVPKRSVSPPRTDVPVPPAPDKHESKQPEPVGTKQQETVKPQCHSTAPSARDLSEKLTEKQEVNSKDKAQEQVENKSDSHQAALAKAEQQFKDVTSKQLVLKFEASEEYENANIVNVIDAESKEVIRQIPSEEVLRISEAISNYVERITQEDMMTDPKLKSMADYHKGAKESLRGAVFDSMA